MTTSLSLPCATTLFTKTLTAHGGDTFLQRDRLQLKGTGTFTTPQELGGLTVPLSSLTLSFGPEGRVRLEALSFGGRLVILHHGTGRGGSVLLAQRPLALPASHMDGIEPLYQLRSAALSGLAPLALADNPHGFVLTPTNLPPMELSVDPQTSRICKSVTRTARGAMTVLLSDYQVHDGIPVFGAAQLLEDGAPLLSLTITEAHFPEAFPPSFFQSL